MNYTRIKLPCHKDTGVLALGAQSKASFCLVKGGVAYLSRPDGDLNTLEDFRFFEKRIKALKRRLKITPRIIACDLHPEYISSKLADDLVKAKGLKIRPVQHHHAHIASCIVDNNVKGDVIGVAFDGTGLGLDGNIWGGEFFTGTIKGFKRAAHLQYVPMPGGEMSIREPWRMALSYLYNIYGEGFKKLNIGFLKRTDKDTVNLLAQIIDKAINSPLTSSMGRFFDAVSSIIGICDVARYEGQAAVELEKEIVLHTSSLGFARDRRFTLHDKYNFKYKDEKGVVVIDWTPVIKGIVRDLQAKKDAGKISLKFHNAVCNMILELCVILRRKFHINRVALSGGVFQNRYLASHIRPILEKQEFKAYLHKDLPAHDGNIALGQAALASKQLYI